MVCGKTNLKKVRDRVEKMLRRHDEIGSVIYGHLGDRYWRAPNASKADFFRLRRRNTSGGGQFTVKGTDRGDNINRIEMDLDVDDYDQMSKQLTVLFGEPIEEVRKRYHVFFLENSDVNVSVYQVDNDQRIFVEIEATAKKRLKDLVKLTEKHLGSELLQVGSSIYDMFVVKAAMKTRSMSKFWESFD